MQGNPVHVNKGKQPTKVRAVHYDQKDLSEADVKTAKQCMALKKDKKKVTWIDVKGLKDSKLLESIANGFGLHPLVIEDIMDTRQRPKVEDYGEYLYIVIRILSYHEKLEHVDTEQFSLILGRNYVISFQETDSDVFGKVIDRIRNSKGKIRRMGPDFLAYSLLDTVVDNYFVILEQVGENVEDVEDELVANPDPETLQNVRNMKKEMLALRKSVWPLREVLTGLERESRNKAQA
jgi:magnesium transporter